jgi:predicted transcriptional regulator
MGKRVTVRLDDTASRGWDRLVEARGVSRTALAEALGQLLAEGDDRWLPEEAVKRARLIDRERRRRR